MGKSPRSGGKISTEIVELTQALLPNESRSLILWTTRNLGTFSLQQAVILHPASEREEYRLDFMPDRPHPDGLYEPTRYSYTPSGVITKVCYSEISEKNPTLMDFQKKIDIGQLKSVEPSPSISFTLASFLYRGTEDYPHQI